MLGNAWPYDLSVLPDNTYSRPQHPSQIMQAFLPSSELDITIHRPREVLFTFKGSTWTAVFQASSIDFPGVEHRAELFRLLQVTCPLV